MSSRSTRWLLFVTALLTLPVPFYLGEPELAPVVRLAFLSGLVGSVFAAEGGGTTGSLLGIGLVQVAVWTGLLHLATRIVARGLARLSAPSARAAIVIGLVVGLLGVSLGDIYDTPLSSTRARSSLLHLFE